MSIDYEELREKAIDPITGALKFIPLEGSDLECAGAAEWGIYSYEQALQSYLSDKIIIPLEMIKEARKVNDRPMCFFPDYKETSAVCATELDQGNALCRLCKLLTEASHRKE